VRRLFSSFAVKVQVSDQYVTVGLIIVLYIFILVFFFRMQTNKRSSNYGHGSKLQEHLFYELTRQELLKLADIVFAKTTGCDPSYAPGYLYSVSHSLPNPAFL